MQHICMAKSLILEHELQNISPGFYDIRRTKVCLLDLLPNISDDGQEGVVENLDIVFGIALSADDPSVFIMACHALCACRSRSSCQSTR